MRTVKDVMTTDVEMVHPDTPFKELVRLFAEHMVAVLPVVDENRCLVGMVSEPDLMLTVEYPAGLREALWYENRHRRIERAKARGAVAADVMTRPVTTVGPEASAAEAEKAMDTYHTERLPVTDAQGRMVGIVSRSDLLKVFLQSDDEIHREIVDDIILDEMLMNPGRFDVEVDDGVVVLKGTCERRSLIMPLIHAVQRVEGVVGVENLLGFDVDDTQANSPPVLARQR